MATQARELRHNVLLTGSGITLLAVFLLATVVGRVTRRTLESAANQRGTEVATRFAALANSYAEEHQRALLLLAHAPMIRAANADAYRRAEEQQLPAQSIPTLERRFARHREIGTDAELRRYLQEFAERAGFEELFFTDAHGYVVLSTDVTSDFVQSDEEWWQVPMRQDQLFVGAAEYDSSAGAVSVEYAVPIAGAGGRPVGVMKGVLGFDRLTLLLSSDDLGDQAYVQLVDRGGRLLVTPDPEQLLKNVAIDSTLFADSTISRVITGPRGAELAIAVPVNQTLGWVVYRQATSAAYALARSAQRVVWISGLLLVGVVVGVLFRLGSWLNTRVTSPVQAAGRVASQIAGGDLSVTISTRQSETGEVGELMSSVQSMVVSLRRLVGAIRSAADEAAAMASQMSASTEQMSASTQEMAATCEHLSQQASEQATLVRSAADDAAKILQIATALSTGADEAARRNAALSELAQKHRLILDQSTAQLSQLADEVHQGAVEAESLATESADIQKFVTQTKAVATQTNMLALNAAIEAARAGPQGRGFAVVADEVRKLAAQAAAAATDTAEIIRRVLSRVQDTRDRLVRLAASGAAAREAAQTAAQGLTTVANDANANDAWSKDIARGATEARRLVEEIASRLGSVAQGTAGLVASAEEMAASAEQQSASTQEIASSANQLAHAADKLTGAVGSFRLLADAVREPPTAQAAD